MKKFFYFCVVVGTFQAQILLCDLENSLEFLAFRLEELSAALSKPPLPVTGNGSPVIDFPKTSPRSEEVYVDEPEGEPPVPPGREEDEMALALEGLEKIAKKKVWTKGEFAQFNSLLEIIKAGDAASDVVEKYSVIYEQKEPEPLPALPDEPEQEPTEDTKPPKPPKSPVMSTVPEKGAAKPNFVSERFAFIEYAKKDEDGSGLFFAIGLVEVDPEKNIFNLVAYGPQLSDAQVSDFTVDGKLAYPVAKAPGLVLNYKGKVTAEGPQNTFVLIDGAEWQRQSESAQKADEASVTMLEALGKAYSNLRDLKDGLQKGQQDKMDRFQAQAGIFVGDLESNFNTIPVKDHMIYANVLQNLKQVVVDTDSLLKRRQEEAEKFAKAFINQATELQASAKSKAKSKAKALMYSKFANALDLLRKRLEAIEGPIKVVLNQEKEWQESLLFKLYTGLIAGTTTAAGIKEKWLKSDEAMKASSSESEDSESSFISEDEDDEDDDEDDDDELEELEEKLDGYYDEYKEKSLAEREQYLIANPQIQEKLKRYVADGGEDTPLVQWNFNLNLKNYDYPKSK